jgi:FG-GAP-like repeat/FG-GAP repeat
MYYFRSGQQRTGAQKIQFSALVNISRNGITMLIRFRNSLPRTFAIAILLVTTPLLSFSQAPIVKSTIKTFSLGTGASGAASIAAGDLNGDGLLDLITANASTNNISVLLGDGKGDFGPAKLFAVGGQPKSIALADFNRDGKLDVVTANYSSGTISVLFGNGDGTFQPQVTLTAGTQTISVATGDMNNDGIPDIVVTNTQSENTDTFLSNGDGTFQPTKQFVFNNGYAGMTKIALGDMNQDGILDVVGIYGYGQGFQVWIGNGDGTFVDWSNSSSYGTIAYPQGLALGDFSGDGKLDVATSLYEDNLIGVSVNDGNGNFSHAFGSPAPPAPILLTVADLNGDSKLDEISTGLTSPVINVALGQGNRYFTPSVRYNVGTPPTAAVVGNFNNDKRPDIAFTTANAVGVIFR